MGKVVVLFVDDEEEFRTLSMLQIKRILKNIDFEFIEASNGEEALQLLSGAVKPSLIILDYAMPKVNGMELLRKIDSDHHHLSDIPRIMITGYNLEHIKSEAQELRCAFLEKSFDNKTFYQKICQFMASKLGFACT